MSFHNLHLIHKYHQSYTTTRQREQYQLLQQFIFINQIDQDFDCLSVLDWIGLDWIGLDWIGLDWIGLDWIGLDWIGLDWIDHWTIRGLFD